MDKQLVKRLTRRDWHKYEVAIMKNIRYYKKSLGENRSYHYYYWGHDLDITVVGHNKAIIEDNYTNEKEGTFRKSVYELPVSKLSFTDDKAFYHSMRNCIKHGSKPVDSFQIKC